MDNVPVMMPLRPGLPVDPVLQLYAGFIAPLQTRTITVGGSVQIALPNPMRVALYVIPSLVATQFSLQPFGVVPSNTIPVTYNGLPLCLHCRDYPGLVQAPWFAVATLGDSFSVWEYVLQGYWGK